MKREKKEQRKNTFKTTYFNTVKMILTLFVSFLSPDDLSKIRISLGESLLRSLSFSEEAAELLDIFEALRLRDVKLFFEGPECLTS